MIDPVTFLDGAFSHANPGISAGIGSAFPGGGVLRVGLGLGGPLVEGYAPVRENLRLGGEVCYESPSDWRLVARLTFFAPRREARSPTPEPWFPDTAEPAPDVTPDATAEPSVLDTALAPATAGTAGR